LFWNPDILPPDTPIILASASPRRQELLTNAGIAFEVRPANIPEIPHADENPVPFAERMAREKARAVRASLPNRTILAADTVVAVEDEILGKPANTEDAIRMLCLLSGRTHAVTTAVCVIAEGLEDVRSETTTVEFGRMSEAVIREYVSTGEPMDKAGAYAIQGGASGWITRIDGDYNNVVGLPVKLVLRMLKERCDR
jgi:septum formation protein